eukprot:TRINITY_DN29660_c0_g2_i1.p1 TRINITY_DN29660_c0_g2~~TRINITY_DN29660_c0_g2_i1.p1  ORF type:complete len:1040 (+),score=190.28 TRINITY_DN29660_c0_g2_i1:393-3122(+)
MDLVDNEFARAMRRATTSVGGGSWAITISQRMLLAKSHVKFDLDSVRNQDALKDTRKIIRNIFWAFEEAEDFDPMASIKSSEPHSHCWALRKLLKKVVDAKAFTGFYLLLTLYALFGPDLLLSVGKSPHDLDGIGVAIFNTIVFVLFVIEEVVLCIAVKGYLFSLRFWMDTCATVSIIGDTSIGLELLQSDAAVAMRTSRLSRAIRGAGRSTRMINLLRGFQVAQIVKLVPRLQQIAESGSRDLGFLLWHKRMQHVFRFVDTEHSGELSQRELECLSAAMLLEFPPAAPQGPPGIPAKVLGMIRADTEIKDKGTVQTSVKVVPQQGNDFAHAAKILWDNASGKRAFQRCLDDIKNMKESCTLVHESMLRLVLKICVLVLALLIMLQLLNGSVDDLSTKQGLLQLSDLSTNHEVSRANLSSIIAERYVFPKMNPVLLVLNGQIFWNSSCHCCDGALRRVSTDTEKDDLLDSVITQLGFGSHEFQLVELKSHDLSNFALIDQHEYERSYALDSLRFTIAVCVMLGVLIMYFAADIKHMSSSNCLHPLWDLMDDMNAMKLIELLTASQNQSTQHTPDAFKQLSRTLMGRRRLPCRAFSPVPVAQELLGLRKSMNLLEAAMVAWSKYVPVELLNQLMSAGIEAKIGCVLAEVSIMFCDVQGFKDLAEGKGPEEVLSLLNIVLTEVNRALEENHGTLLEFIGDEVLAVFNAPRKIAGHSHAAVNAAVSAVEYAAQIKGQPVRLQCSVHTGTVLAGNLGSPTRMKYGVLGDGVNLTARLKALNSRYGTQLLVSADAMSYIDCQDDLVRRTIGKLILKGRTTPTHTYEVLGRKGNLPENLRLGAESHDEAFECFVEGRFGEAKALFQEAHKLLTEGLEPATDRPAAHMIELCEKYLENPPPMDTWDGSEHLTKKAW